MDDGALVQQNAHTPGGWIEGGGVNDGKVGFHLPLPFGRAARSTCTLPLLASVTRFVLRIVVPEVIIVFFVVVPVYRGRFLLFRCLGLGWGRDILWSDRCTWVE